MADGVSVNGIGARRASARAAPSSWADRHIAWLLALPAVLLILALSIYPLDQRRVDDIERELAMRRAAQPEANAA